METEKDRVFTEKEEKEIKEYMFWKSAFYEEEWDGSIDCDYSRSVRHEANRRRDIEHEEWIQHHLDEDNYEKFYDQLNQLLPVDLKDIEQREFGNNFKLDYGKDTPPLEVEILDSENPGISSHVRLSSDYPDRVAKIDVFHDTHKAIPVYVYESEVGFGNLHARQEGSDPETKAKINYTVDKWLPRLLASERKVVTPEQEKIRELRDRVDTLNQSVDEMLSWVQEKELASAEQPKNHFSQKLISKGAALLNSVKQRVVPSKSESEMGDYTDYYDSYDPVPEESNNYMATIDAKLRSTLTSPNPEPKKDKALELD